MSRRAGAVVALLLGLVVSAGLRDVGAQSPLVPGGLTALAGIYGLGPTVAVNGDFESHDGSRPANWTADAAWSIDADVMQSGAASLRLSDAPAVPFHQVARQTLQLRKGIYKLSGWIKAQDLGANTSGSGVRLNLDYSAGGVLMRGLTPIVAGTRDWTYFEKTNIVVPDDRTATLKLEAYKEPSGTAWFDDVRVEEQRPAPVEAFLLHPSYRGMLFDDQPPTIRLDLTLTPPAGDFAGHEVRATLVDDSGTAVATRSYAAAPTLVAELDGSVMQEGRAYEATVALVARESGSVVYTAPAYRLSRVSAATRASMNVAFDEKNRILISGQPRFLLGVYDSGMGYGTTDAFWEQALWSPTGERRMDGLRINVYLNYFYGHATPEAMSALMSNLSARGVVYLQTGNCFQQTPAATRAFAIDASDGYVQSLGGHAGSAGYYTIDECDADLVPGAFAQYRRLAALDPDSMTFGALLGTPPAVFLWGDSADVLATDPYPLFGAEPAGGYPHGQVAEWTSIARQAVLAARPIMTVLQFFKFTSAGRFPTREEMRSHAYMAIVEAARGLMWWSLGANALRDVCAGWCDAKTALMADLKTVVGEIADLEPALLADDTPEALAGNSSSAIRTKVTTNGGKGYVFAYNRTGAPASVTFTWQTQPGDVTVHGEGRTLPVTGSSFSDTFAPYQGRAYVIDGPALTVAFQSPLDGATVSSVTTVTAIASGGSGHAYTFAADGTTFATTPGGSADWDTRGLANGPHTLTVSVTDAEGRAATATINVTVANATVPAAPTDATASATGSERIVLAWTDRSDNEAAFRIERSTGAGAFTEIATVAADVTGYTDTGLAPQTAYSYRVRASNTAGDSAYSNTATATTPGALPTAPTGLTATAVSSSRIDLRWSDASSDESGFRVERSTDGVTFTQIASVGPNVTSFASTGLTGSTTYHYRVRAFSAAGSSAYSEVVSATTRMGLPGRPTGLTATRSGTSVALGWTDGSVDESEFRIYRSRNGGSFTRIAEVGPGVTAYTDTTVASRTRYSYRVRAYNPVGSSAYSNTASVTTSSP